MILSPWEEHGLLSDRDLVTWSLVLDLSITRTLSVNSILNFLSVVHLLNVYEKGVMSSAYNDVGIA